MRYPIFTLLLVSGFAAWAADISSSTPQMNEAIFYGASVQGGHGDFDLGGLWVSADGKVALVQTGIHESSMSRFDVTRGADGRSFTLTPHPVEAPNWTTGDGIAYRAMANFKANGNLTIHLNGTAASLTDVFKTSGQHLNITKDGSIEMADGFKMKGNVSIGQAETNGSGPERMQFPGKPSPGSQVARPTSETRAAEAQGDLFDKISQERAKNIEDGNREADQRNRAAWERLGRPGRYSAFEIYK